MNEKVSPGGTAPADDAATPARLLFVDDEPSILAALKRLFHRRGYTLFTAASGAEGLALLEREPVDVVVSDMRMPEMDGAQFLEQVFARWPDTKRILLTGYADVSATIAAINQGKIWRYVAKPWDDNEIVLTVEQALNHRRLMRENARLTRLTQAQNEELKTLNASLEARVEERTRQLQQALKSVREGFVSTVHVFSSVLELRGGPLAGHSRRVADNARKLARQLGMDESGVQETFLAALLHDIGKIGLPDELMERPFNALPAGKRAEIMRHPERGELLLMPIPQLAGAANLIRHHHEQFDGGGYPDGLSGMAIPFGARVLAVANDHDALQLGTLVSRPLSPDEAWRYLVDNRGKRYDPAVVDAFSAVLAAAAGEGHAEIPMRPASLRPGMRLARDLTHRDGYLLLARGHVLQDNELNQLRRLEAAEGQPLTLYVEP